MDPEELFEASSPLARRLAGEGPYGSGADLIERARRLAPSLSPAEKVATLDAHPRIGEDRARLSRHSAAEQARDPAPELDTLNLEYERRFGFRFVTFVNRRSNAEVAEEIRRRLASGRERELEAGLAAVIEIAAARLLTRRHEIRYGKAEITVYRTHATPLEGVPAIPESTFQGRPNTLFAGAVTVDVFGEDFWAAYTEGDNAQVVPTDTMKNFTYQALLDFPGATHEGFAARLGSGFLETYPQMGRVRVRFRETPYEPITGKLLAPLLGDHGFVDVEVDRAGIVSMLSGRRRMRLVKLTGSSFAGFPKDGYTTLPERADRPLHVFLDVHWRHLEPARAAAEERGWVVPSEQVRDLARSVFDGFVSRSIQHLVHEMAERALERFPQLSEVVFEAQNRLWDTSAASDSEPSVKVYSDPKPAHGSIALTLRRG